MAKLMIALPDDFVKRVDRAVSVRGNWRVTFKFVDKDADAVDYEDYH